MYQAWNSTKHTANDKFQQATKYSQVPSEGRVYVKKKDIKWGIMHTI